MDEEAAAGLVGDCAGYRNLHEGAEGGELLGDAGGAGDDNVLQPDGDGLGGVGRVELGEEGHEGEVGVERCEGGVVREHEGSSYARSAGGGWGRQGDGGGRGGEVAEVWGGESCESWRVESWRGKSWGGGKLLRVCGESLLGENGELLCRRSDCCCIALPGFSLDGQHLLLLVSFSGLFVGQGRFVQ